ncbi:ribosome small subunit-dependent GTPase A [Paenibacillus sp. TRM 82003]|nr:ribosome small subunit-dependent GTPase A [Paenibacillus sp. TRM 82003]
MSEIKAWGWDDRRENEFAEYRKKGWIPGRIALEHKRMYRVWTEQGELLAELTGKLRHEAEGRDDFPAVGDWIAVAPRVSEGRGTVQALLERRSKFSRRAAGNETTEQIVAANVDTVFLVMSLNQDFNVRRLERYLLLAWESGASPVVVLTKADVCDDPERYVRETSTAAIGVPTHAVSAETGFGMEAVRAYLTEGRTAALLGSSGVGKSTLANALLGAEAQRVSGIREKDGRGRHTTTHRELALLPSGGLLIDTPGMRELQLWDVGAGLSHTFEEIEALAGGCRFGDCRHEKEPGCAVQEAIRNGTLDEGRLAGYRKMLAEAAYAARKEEEKRRRAASRR